MMQVEVDNNTWLEVSLTPEIYYLLSDQDRSQLDDPRTRKTILNKMESEAFFEHEDLAQLELYLIREDRKRAQERELQGSNIEININAKNAGVVQRFLARRTTREEEEDERLRQREVQEIIEEHEEETEEVDEAEVLRRAEEFLIRMATLALLERRLEEARERLDGGGGARVEEVNSSEEEDDESESSEDDSESQTARTTTSATSTITSRTRHDREITTNTIVTQPGTGSRKKRDKSEKRSSNATGNDSKEKNGEKEKNKKGESKTGFWGRFASCLCCGA